MATETNRFIYLNKSNFNNLNYVPNDTPSFLIKNGFRATIILTRIRLHGAKEVETEI